MQFLVLEFDSREILTIRILIFVGFVLLNLKFFSVSKFEFRALDL